MTKKSYEAAVEELNEILADLENDEISIDQLAKKIKKAQELITFCKDKLRKAEEDVNKIVGESEE